MFSRVAGLLALLPMLLHSILGCCWHHAHHLACEVDRTRVVCQTGVKSTADTRAEHSAAACHHHPRQADHDAEAAIPGESPADPSPHSPCDEEQCLFAITSKGGVQQTATLQRVECGFCVATVELAAPVCSLVAARHDLPGGWLPCSSGRSCALTQVWLI